MHARTRRHAHTHTHAHTTMHSHAHTQHNHAHITKCMRSYSHVTVHTSTYTHVPASWSRRLEEGDTRSQGPTAAPKPSRSLGQARGRAPPSLAPSAGLLPVESSRTLREESQGCAGPPLASSGQQRSWAAPRPGTGQQSPREGTGLGLTGTKGWKKGLTGRWERGPGCALGAATLPASTGGCEGALLVSPACRPRGLACQLQLHHLFL